MRRHSQQGIALVITLILLSVITFLAITFLILSRREHGSVATTTDQQTAKFAADAALADAEARLIAPMLAFTNDQAYGLTVSTNYVNWAGFAPGVANPTNVNYYYTSAAGRPPLDQASFLQNVANLEYAPRPPVYISTNSNTAFPNDFRFYLDLNRNGRYDTNGALPVISPDPATPFYDTNGNETANFNPPNVLSNTFTGDPEWIGILAHPDQPHSSSNYFLARYAYMVVPASKTLDINYIHNQAVSKSLDIANDGFFRNQGVGSWEINLAAFLADLNTNMWYPDNGKLGTYYLYNQPVAANRGIDFLDAQAILDYRYGNSYANLSRASALFPNAADLFRGDNIDEYSDGLLMTLNRLEGELGNLPDPVNQPWAGADNPNHFFTTQDLFDRAKFPQPFPNFVDRLSQAGTNVDSYDRYTYYRLLSQLGTGSDPESGKINVNYRNVDDSGNVVPDMETNLYAWTDPLQFFTNAAAAMFRDYNLRDSAGNLITVTNIPLYPTNYYTPAVHRILQLAANIYDATTNGLYPTIFRPTFNVNGTNISVGGYQLVDGPNDPSTPDTILTIPVSLEDPIGRTAIANSPQNINVYGVPWVIGAKKGFPNFNEFALQSVSEITRKLQFARPNSSTYPPTSTNQMLLVSVSNVLAGVEVWNSYRTNYPPPTYIQADGFMSAMFTLTNANLSVYRVSTNVFLGGYPRGAIDLTGKQWPGYGNGATPNPNSFLVPMFTNVLFMTNAYYDQRFGRLVPVPPNEGADFFVNTGTGFPSPTMGLVITNRIRCIIRVGGGALGANGRVVDYVQLDNLNMTRNLTSEQSLEGNIYSSDPASPANNMWSTNVAGNATVGVQNQIQASLGYGSPLDWNDSAKQNEISGFQSFMWPGHHNTNLLAQAPYTPTAENSLYKTWQANDPLVHYTAADLNYLAESTNVQPIVPTGNFTNRVLQGFYQVTDRYDPWGGNPAKGSDGDPNAFTIALKDPGLKQPDDWDFPTNRFPNIGWLGRVHRGTPWQTVYMKASGTIQTNWIQWTGDNRLWPGDTNNLTPDVNFNIPTDDRLLFDVFTAAPNDNATRGQLSVNQTNLAAWSAVLSGVVVLTNDPTPATNGWTTIEPAGYFNSALPLTQQTNPLVRIWQGINAARDNTNTAAGPVFPGHVFAHVGDVLAAPQLTEASPYLNLSGMQSPDNRAGGISDEVMERIPQQIMSLLTLSHEPKFVIYAYGQTLHPANHSLVTGGNYFGLCTNYQITAETAVRAVIRVVGAPTNTHTVVESYNVLPSD